ncbi:MAG: Lrp/AsnC family transcriptional regulator [Candidatus Lokiarchaeota archaeon]|nr:Lrp/AsnC family transcriptional regulator [Candidatus Lokiarchaeota archaeon]
MSITNLFQKKIFNIVESLNSNFKPSISEICRNLNISRQTLKKDLITLKFNGIIKNFTINIHPNIQPNLKYVILEIKTNPNEPGLVKNMLKIPQLILLDGIFGEFSLIALFVFKDSEEFNDILAKIDNIMANSYFKKYKITEVIRVFKTNGIMLSKSTLNKIDLDETDRLILNSLKKDQGIKLISTHKMSKLLKLKNNVEISQSTIYNRIKRLEESDVILNYSMNFCPRKIGFNGKYIVRVKPKDPSRYKNLALRLEQDSHITDLFRIGEQYGLFAIVRVRAIEDYGNFIKNLYKEDIEDTFTNFILDELISHTNYVLD